MMPSHLKLLSREPTSNATVARSQPAGSTNSTGADARGWKAKCIHTAAKVAVKVLRHYDPFLTPSTHSLTYSSPRSTTSSLATSKSSIENPEDDKAEWGPTKDIDPVLICRLVKRLVGHEYGDRCWLQEKHAGTFNQAYVVMFDDGADGIKIVIKVPATGWAPRWCEQDAVYLRSEALTLRYIHQKCDDVPFVPQMLAYDTTFDNEINAPFILMTHLKGRPAWQVWGFLEDPDMFSWPVQDYDRRSNLLSSLAAAMVKLKRVKFDAIGLPDYLDDNCKGPFVRTEFRSHEIAAAEEKDEQALHSGAPCPQREWAEIPTFSSTKDFFLYWCHNVARQFKRSEIDHTLSYEDAGLIKFLGLLPAQIPRSRPDFCKGRPETFSLAHNDLDWQNILCDDYGNVTGIIDWEGACSRPSSFGWAQVPLFLRRDWDTDYRWPWDTLEYHLFPDQMQWFRKQYVAKLHDLEPRRSSDKGPSHPAVSYLTCSLYDTCRYSPDNIRVWCDRFLRMAVPSVGEDFFHRAGMGKGWIFLPRLFEDETMPLNKWLEQYNIYHYLNHGCSSMELKLTEAPKPAKDCSKCWARDDHDNQSDYSVSDDSTEDRVNDKDATLFDEEHSRPSTPATDVSLSPSRALVKWNLLPQITKTGDTKEEALRVHDIPLSTNANPEDSNFTAAATQSWPLPSHLHPCSSAEPALSSNTASTSNQQTIPWNSDCSKVTSSKAEFSTLKVTTEPFAPKMGALKSCITSSSLQHAGGKKSKLKKKA